MKKGKYAKRGVSTKGFAMILYGMRFKMRLGRMLIPSPLSTIDITA